MCLLGAFGALGSLPGYAFSSDMLKRHVQWLADERLKGRLGGSPEERQVAEYVARAFRDAKLTPLDPQASYFQFFPLPRFLGTGRQRRGLPAESTRSQNVVGWLEGRDEILKHEYIVIGAHLDHLGFGTLATRGGPTAVGQLHPGAGDNASGVACLLELVKALAALPKDQRPKRSLVFVGFGAEELGLVGSKAFVQQPSVSLTAVVAMVNLAEMARGEGRGYVFTNDVVQTAPFIRTAQGPSPAIQLTVWSSKLTMSDAGPFADRGIFCAWISGGGSQYPDYHRPTDTWDKINYEELADLASVAQRFVLALADARLEPAPHARGAISPSALQAHVQALSSETLRGRESGSPDERLAAERIAHRFASAGLHPLGEGGSFFQSLTLSARLPRTSLHPQGVDIPPDRRSSQNVIGWLEGSDDRLKQEVVVVGAHLDHLGFGRLITRGGPGAVGRIHPGAGDNASGVACLLELVKALAALPKDQRPKRSLVFVGFGAEEYGLVGSKHYAEHPAISLSQTVAMINLAEMARGDGHAIVFTNAIHAAGALGQQAALPTFRASMEARSSDLTHSDAGPFAAKRLPCFWITGLGSDYPEYHTPADTWDKINYEELAELAEFSRRFIIRVANHDGPIPLGSR